MYSMCMAENTSTVNISFREDLLKEIDRVARSESRSRSELVREAARIYIERKRRMKSILESVQKIALARGLTEDDVAEEIKAYRESKRS